MASYSKEEIENLIDGRLPWPRARAIISGPKDDDRFEKYLQILQKRVAWQEPILLPLTEHLYIVQKDDQRIVKCDCGQEFGDYRINWKLFALISVRDTNEQLDEVFFGPRKPDPEYCEVREYYCPGCGAQLEVETLPVGYPAIFDFLPDLDAFYSDWLNEPLAPGTRCTDLTYEVIGRWREHIEEGMGDPPASTAQCSRTDR
jgi:acetone carboxylase, gamma subunit